MRRPILFLLLLLAACTPTTPTNLASRIEIQGSGTADIAYEIRNHRVTRYDVALPWHYDFTVNIDDHVAVAAMSFEGGSLRCIWRVQNNGNDRNATEVSYGVLSSASDVSRGSKVVSCGGAWGGYN